ncbi:MAG: CCA tRNA nucleotidyltransferase [Verrucomicrobiaceae bacterium]|nr:CCA tRNA nucleotidyltransferase [Verrucomicrobiaceae bacterium]
MREVAIQIIEKLHAAGHTALLAGGCVRDMLLGREAKDYDVATSARPEQVVALFPGSKTVGAHFGVVVVRAGKSDFVEVATFRSDGSYSDGRRPDSVVFSTPEIDAQRRDFTINGLFFDPVAKKVIDYVGGENDLRVGLLRAIGVAAQRFEEDRLRLLRAVRFATVLGFDMEDSTWHSVCGLAEKITSVSIERVREEFSKIMLHENRVRGFDLLVGSGLMQHILPEILILQGCEQPPQFHPEGDVFVHTRMMLGLLPAKVSLPLVMSVLLHDIAKPATQTRDADTGRIRFNGHDKLGAQMTDVIMRRMKFPNDVIEPTVVAVEHHMTFMEVKKMRTATLKRMLSRPTIDDELALHRVDCLGSNGRLDNYEFMLSKREEFANAPLVPPRLINGADLIRLGWHAGPAMGRLLNTLQTLQLDGELQTKEQALAWITANAPVAGVFEE